MTRVLKNPGRSQETVALPSSAPQTLVVDGNYLLKCAYHATVLKPEFNIGGRHIGIVHEFLRKLRWLVEHYHITKCVVFWDGAHGGKLRHDLYPYYKANRKNKEWYRGPSKSQAQAEEDAKTQRSIESQKVRVQTYLEELYVRQGEQPLMEGDDMMAHYCQSYHGVERIIIFTNDRDMCQMLVLNGVSIYLDNLKLLINRDNFDVEFPYHYSNVAVVKIMCGDTSDNIKGVKGMGLDTLLKHFPALVDGPVSVGEIKAEAHRLCEERRLARQKPLQVLQNVTNGVAMRLHYGEEAPHAFGDALYELNTQLMDLSTPMLTREARAEVLNVGASVLEPTDRGTKNLLPLFAQDHLLRYYGNDLRRFVQPFFPLVAREQEAYKAHQLA